jgi:hypothetical protein
MLRELSTVLLELQESLLPFGAGSLDETGTQVRLHAAQLVLPLDLRIVLAEGAPQLQADVPRSSADLNWRGEPSRLSLSIVAELAE